MSSLTPVQWKEEFINRLAEELENTELAYISETRVEELMEMYGDDDKGAKEAAELERENIASIIEAAQDDEEEEDESDDEEEDESDDEDEDESDDEEG